MGQADNPVQQSGPARVVSIAPVPQIVEHEAETGEIGDAYEPSPEAEADFNQEPEPEPEVRITFGKHKGKLLSEIPADYLQWLVNGETTKPDTKAMAQGELTRRGK
jgi:hypothetical protein